MRTCTFDRHIPPITPTSQVTQESPQEDPAQNVRRPFRYSAGGWELTTTEKPPGRQIIV
jgi:hypothetical protein